MNGKRGMNKKAQEGGASGFTIVGWVILAILLVIIILAIAGFFNPLLEKLNLVPGGGISALVSACDGYSSASLAVDYCAFRAVTIDGVKQWKNCADTDVMNAMQSENRGKFTCAADADRKECVLLFKQGTNNPMVNGVSCYSKNIPCIGEGGLDGSNPNGDGNCIIAPNTKKVTIDSSGKSCCVAPAG